MTRWDAGIRTLAMTSDLCPRYRCYGALTVTDTTGWTWHATCATCGRKAHLNGDLEWEATRPNPYGLLLLLAAFAVLAIAVTRAI